VRILVTGGAGYIGSHTVIELMAKGYDVTVVDNLANSSDESLHRVEKITGKPVAFVKLDVCDSAALSAVFDSHHFDAVIHFAGLKAVAQSIERPLHYYRINIDSTLTLCEVMAAHDVRKFIFSSSATVYGIPAELPLRETSTVGVGLTNPYGKTKYFIENILQDLAAADPRWQITLLRYFNPIGAHESGLIGEDPQGTPNNLLPYVSQVAVGKRDHINIFGDDYDTPDGTALRDYIHVLDLARGHVAALEHMPESGSDVYNLGTGRGTSVFELIHAFEKACGKELPYEVVARRPGDVESCYADVSKAASGLGWHAEKSIEEACADSWRWQSGNPDGFRS
jgi:UDP-glucose 4-epimerase